MGEFHKLGGYDNDDPRRRKLSSNVGIIYQRTVAQSLFLGALNQVTSKREIYIPAPKVPSPLRDSLTLNKKVHQTHVQPDLVGNMSTIFSVNGRSQIIELENSSVIEIKATSEAYINSNYDNYQTAGIIGNMAFTPAYLTSLFAPDHQNLFLSHFFPSTLK
jgi:hypothetical protein